MANQMVMGSKERNFGFMISATRAALIGLFGLMLIASLHPDVRSQIRTSVLKDFRVVVSTAKGDLLGVGTHLTVAKVKTRDSLLLEVYESVADGTQRLMERIELPDKKDGFFNFNGQATNLAIDDVDGDGRLEIIAPSFDQNLVGHLNIYHYDQGARGFQRVLR